MAESLEAIPILDLSWTDDPVRKDKLLQQLRSALFEVGFLYITNHGVPHSAIDGLTRLLPTLFDLPSVIKEKQTKLNSPHFLGYSGFAEEVTLGQQDLREQFDFATELPVVYQEHSSSEGFQHKERRDFSKSFWRLRGPNQWPPEDLVPGFRNAFMSYHDAVQQLSYRFVHLIEEAFSIPVGTFDSFFSRDEMVVQPANDRENNHHNDTVGKSQSPLAPQHRIKLVKYPPTPFSDAGQGVGAHKDSSGWLTFLYQVGNEKGLEVLSSSGKWLPASPITGSFVVIFGNAFEAATEGAVKATVHRVVAPGPDSNDRYSIPFFQGLPLDMTVSEIRSVIPEHVRSLRKLRDANDGVSTFLDPRWDSLGESQLRKWIRSHKDVGLKWYGSDAVEYYTH
ncbi:Clavaminate synthase-like protein [Polychaeton citri CBS 116435]|uniref:Clavaminate synthase-like protein n=1 Tax=Polychaeton citri CBS 116435 TaxID=1314669 RepID=A0A9P4Q7S7_9PEZI|nr:Clavaminate synthase-like protein [Polychaeton citri CBS 116435]